jgi:hypothetical protein
MTDKQKRAFARKVLLYARKPENRHKILASKYLYKLRLGEIRAPTRKTVEKYGIVRDEHAPGGWSIKKDE